jgi:putative toxin-antitoxin system antitoxin component (TIGR02293 family)
MAHARKVAQAGPASALMQGSVDFTGRVMACMNALLGSSFSSDGELLNSVLAGLSPEVVDHLQQEGLRPAELRFIIPPRTLGHRKIRNEALDVAESDRAVRAARLFAFAETTFGDRERAQHWLRTPKKRFDGKAPIDMMRSELGARQVEDVLMRIDEGYFA